MLLKNHRLSQRYVKSSREFIVHSHSYKKEDWPFHFDDAKLVVTTKFVMNGSKPIVEVLHWEDGDWQFMCNTTNNSADGMLVCMGCVFEQFPWIKKFKDLKAGHLSFFDEELNDWVVEKIECN